METKNNITKEFELQVLNNPSGVALEYKDKKMTYLELNNHSNQLAYELIKYGAKPGDFVAFCLERSIETIVTMLGILKAGCAYLPIDPNYPKERIELMLRDANIKYLITISNNKMIGVLNVSQLIFLDEISKYKSNQFVENPNVPITLDNPAYINFTSGSTGIPKGVVIPHRGVIRLVKNTNYHSFCSDEIFSHFSPISFDAATFEIWGSLINGARLAIFPGEITSLEDLRDFIVKKNITTLWITSGLFHQMVDHYVSAFKKVRYLFTGGDVLSPKHVRLVLNKYKNITVINGYGPTENTVFTTCYPMTNPNQVNKTVPIGKPIKGTNVVIVGEDGIPVKPNYIGELYVGGDGLALGYLNRPKLNEEKFIIFNKQKMYKTGDLVRELPNGLLEFVGRIDTQVKIRGHRVELTEIEFCLGEHPSINQAIVVAKEENGNKQLVAYFTLKPGQEIGEKEVMEYLRQRLPQYMVPTTLCKVSEFPLLPSGKVDRANLPNPFERDSREIIEPKTETEKILVDIIKEVIGNIGINESYWEVGGDSLKAILINSRIRQQFGVQLKLNDFFNYNISELAGKIDKLKKENNENKHFELYNLNNISSKNNDLSSSQKQQWVLYKITKNKILYNINEAYLIKGSLNKEILWDSIKSVAKKHDLLRMKIVEDSEGNLKRDNLKELPIETLQFIDLSKEDIYDIDEYLKRYSQTKINLKEGPPLRIFLFKISLNQYILLFIIHHIIFDAWSMGLLSYEISSVYKNKINKKYYQLEKSNFNFSHYVDWENKIKNSIVINKQLDYWNKQLKNIINNPPYLITDYPRPNKLSYKGDIVYFKLPLKTLNNLKKFSQKHKITLYTCLLSGFSILLQKLSGQNQIIIGTHVAGRTLKEFENIIGYFVNTLVLNLDLSNDPSICKHIKHVQDVVDLAIQNKDVRFEELVKELNPDRSLSYNPIFQVAFILQNASMNKWDLPNIDFERIFISNGTSKFDLSLIMEETNDGLEGYFEYSTDLFKRETINNYVRMYLRILDKLTKLSDDVKISDVVIDEKQMIKLNTYKKEKTDDLLHCMIEEVIPQYYNKIAVKYNNNYLTYYELNDISNKFAHFLREKGITRNSIVAVLMDRSIDFVIVLLAILKAGGAYLPLDPSYPKERIKYMLRDSGAQIVLTNSKIINNYLISGNFESIAVDKEKDIILKEQPNIPIENINQSDDIAYIIYTSGSTGHPKGVEISHKSICNHMRWMQRRFPLSKNDKVLQKTPISFDASIWEFFAPLLSGAELILGEPLIHNNPRGLVNKIKENNISILQVVPTQLKMLLKEPEFQNCTSLKRVFSGGEILQNSIYKQFSVKFPHTELINLYGPTESTINATFHVCNEEIGVAIPIGRPIDGIITFVMDEKGRPLPQGMIGELYLGGVGLARGYRNKPDLTDNKFIYYYLSNNRSIRLYRTGDLVRENSNGNLEFLGRVDSQIKLHGYRIEIEEITNKLLELPMIKDVFIKIHTSYQGKRLVAYMVPKGEKVSISYIRDFLQHHLPNYMVPSFFVWINEFPKLPNGKIDISSFPDPVISIENQNNDLVNSITEKEIKEIWKSVLGIKQISRDDNFFHIGGNSLLAIQFLSIVNKKYKQDISIQLLFDNPKLREFAKIIEKRKSLTNKEDKILIKFNKKRSEILSSFEQYSIWLSQQFEPNLPLYNMPYLVKLHGKINADLIKKSIEKMIDRHNILSKKFVEKNGQLYLMESKNRFEFEIIDKRGSDKYSILDEILIKSKTPFSLTKGPLLRCTIYHIEDNFYTLLLEFHHSVFDGFSLKIFFDEFFKLINGRELDDITFDYSDFIEWQLKYFKSESFKKSLNYWKKQLFNLPTLELPIDYSRKPIISHKGNVFEFDLNTDEVKKLKEFADGQGVTLAVLMLAVFQVFLSKYSGQNEFGVGMPVACRNVQGTESLIGLFVNTLIIRANLTEKPSFIQFLKSVKENVLNALKHQNVPFEILKNELGIERDPSYSPLIQALFSYENDLKLNENSEGICSEIREVNLGISKFELSLTVREVKNYLTLQFEYNDDLFSRDKIVRMANNFKYLLHILIKKPEKQICQLSILSPEENQKVLHDWYLTDKKSLPDCCIHHLFEQKAQLKQDIIAIRQGEREISYKKLNIKANQVAHFLRKMNIGTKKRVGIFCDRSIEMVIGILGVLKSGATYVPLDPDYPRERLLYMLKDANIDLVLTQTHLDGIFKQINITSLILDQHKSVFDNESFENPKISIAKEDVAYIMYTSGSTGEPKGVMVSHYGLLNHTLAALNLFKLNDNDRVLQFSSICFDIAIEEIFPTLLSGAMLILRDKNIVETTDNFSNFIQKNKITVLNLPTAYWHEWVNSMNEGETLPKNLRLTVIGGESASWKLYEKWLSHSNNQIELINTYGPTETTVTATYFKPNPNDKYTSMPIGKPITNVEVYILDENQLPVPIGVPGELYIGGPGVALGYINKPKHTLEKFIPNPLKADRGVIFRTGDLVKYMPDGNIQFLKRVDNQIKIRGYRIELEEVKRAIEGLDEVDQAVVYVKEIKGLKQLVAYLVLNNKFNISALELRSKLQKYLPEYMIPVDFYKIERVCLTNNGKIDYEKLPDTPISAKTLIERSATSIERTVIKIWKEIFNNEKINIYSHFFHLGGHSLLAMRMIAMLKNQFLVELPLRCVYDFPTIEKLSKFIGESLKSNNSINNHPSKHENDEIDVNWLSEEDINNLTDEEVDSLLEKLLSNKDNISDKF